MGQIIPSLEKPDGVTNPITADESAPSTIVPTEPRVDKCAAIADSVDHIPPAISGLSPSR